MVQNILQAAPGQTISIYARSGIGFMVRVKVRVKVRVTSRVGISVRVMLGKRLGKRLGLGFRVSTLCL